MLELQIGARRPNNSCECYFCIYPQKYPLRPSSPYLHFHPQHSAVATPSNHPILQSLTSPPPIDPLDILIAIGNLWRVWKAAMSTACDSLWLDFQQRPSSRSRSFRFNISAEWSLAWPGSHFTEERLYEFSLSKYCKLSSAVVTCAKLLPGWIVRIKGRTKKISQNFSYELIHLCDRCFSHLPSLLHVTILWSSTPVTMNY